MTALIGNRYEVLEKLGAGGMGTVWLVKDKLRNQLVALKQVLLPDDDQRLAITREFRTLSTLRHPNIVSVIDYGSHENLPYFTMEYLPALQPFNPPGDTDPGRFVPMLQALGYLHRRGVLHRDLKPGNVLVTMEGRVKVVDFGLAYETQKTNNDSGAEEASQEIVGTLNYMAPELFKEQPPSIASDLWSVGVMLAEILSGYHPFDNTSMATLLMSIMNNLPDLNDIEPGLQAVVMRLLAKEPEDRYRSALETLHALCAVAEIDLPPESREQRESFLQAADFVGRDQEYQTLVEGLKMAMTGKGHLWLMGGEAGAGKSRLLDEVRTWALVEGFMVLQGQGVEGGGLPYQVWRDPARKLTLGVSLSELGASVLKELVPDMETLIEREVADAPTLEPKANRDRLMAVLVERLRAVDSPILIILEDLHWAGESLELLKLLVPQLATMPIMIIGSYRHDEKPTLPAEFPTANLLMIERLSVEAVASLSASMIGEENATPELVARLARETEGNALFMVEVMRTLAEEAGSLQDISHQSLPDRILAGGMVATLQRRLSRVPQHALGTLRLAAVIGRQIDQAVLLATGVTDTETWLQTCAEASVLEPYGGDWRFSHDRLREVLLHDLTDLPFLHEKVALALESVYPDDADYAEALAEHWRIAGNADKEVYYILKAAEPLILFRGDYARAESLLQRGLDLNLPATRAELSMWLSASSERQSRFEESLVHIENGLASNPLPGVQARLLNRKGMVFARQGKFGDAREVVQAARTVAETQNDRSAIATSLNMLGTVASIQGDYATARAHYEESSRIQREIGQHHGIAANLNNLGNVVLALGETEAAIAYYEDSLVLWKEVGDRQGMAMTLNNLGRIGDDYEKRSAYHEESLHLRRSLGDQWGIANSLFNLASMTFDQENYEAAQAYFAESLAINRTIGSLESVASSGAGLVITLGQLGEEIPRATLLEAAQAVREVDSLYATIDIVIAALYVFPTHAPAWIGLILEKRTQDYIEHRYFEQMQEKTRLAIGDDAYNIAVEQGRSLDVRAVIEEIIQLLQTDSSLHTGG